MGTVKDEYVDHLIIEELAEKVANEPMEDMVEDVDLEFIASVPKHVWVENKVEETRERMKEIQQREKYDDYTWNWSGLR